MIQDNRQVQFAQDVRDSLDRNDGHDRLLDIVRQFKAAGGTQRQAYDSLQAVWLEHGFAEDEGVEPNSIRDDLEFTMEVVWGFCSSGQAIWQESLSTK